MDITFDVAEQLFPNIATMIVQLCSTGVIFLVAYKFLFNPVRDFLASKSELTNKELEDAKLANEEAKKNVEETRKQLKEASYQAKEIIENNNGYSVGHKDSVYLTFDVGYDNGYLDKYLDILKKENVKVIIYTNQQTNKIRESDLIMFNKQYSYH